MPLAKLLLAWICCSGWFIGWELVTRRLRRESGARDVVDVAPGVLVFEGLWLVLFTALWFASLGRGGWGLVLPLLALVASWTPVMGRQLKLAPGKRFVAFGVQAMRLIVAGVLAGVLV